MVTILRRLFVAAAIARFAADLALYALWRLSRHQTRLIVAVEDPPGSGTWNLPSEGQP